MKIEIYRVIAYNSKKKKHLNAVQTNIRDDCRSNAQYNFLETPY